MSKFLSGIILLAILTSYVGLSQTKKGEGVNETKSESTKLGEFISKKGQLTVKDFYEIGIYKDQYGQKAEFTGIVLYDPTKEKIKVKGIKVEFTKSGKYGEENKTCFLDLEEIETSIKSINYMMELAKTYASNSKEYSEVTFATKDDFKLGFYQKNLEQVAFSSLGEYSAITIFPSSIDDLIKIKELLEKGLNRLTAVM